METVDILTMIIALLLVVVTVQSFMLNGSIPKSYAEALLSFLRPLSEKTPTTIDDKIVDGLEDVIKRLPEDETNA